MTKNDIDIIHEGSDESNAESADAKKIDPRQILIGEPLKIFKKLSGLKLQVRKNTVTNLVEFKRGKRNWKEFEEEDFNDLYLYCLQTLEKCSVDKVRRMIYSSNFMRMYDPFIDFFQSQKPYSEDEPDWIRMYYDALESDYSDKYRMLFFRWILATCASLIGTAKNEVCLVLQGPQFSYKTTYLNAMFKEVAELAPYLVVMRSVDMTSTDSKRMLIEKGLINFDELGDLSKHEHSSIKSAFSLEEITVRLPYQVGFLKKRRRASFVGSTNDVQFLSDPTGSRRFLVFPVKSIDIKKLENIDFTRLWVQARYCLDNGETVFLTPDEVKEINAGNEQFQKLSEAEEMLLELADNPKDSLHSNEWYTATILAGKLTEKPENSTFFVNSLGKALAKNGYQRKKIGGMYKWAVSLKRRQ